MTLWRLEWLRIARTRRWMVVLGVYSFFGVTGPLLARYLQELADRFGGGQVTIVAPDPRPIDGIIQFLGNASQLGLLSVVVVAVSTLAIDTRPEFAAFLRTKVARPRALLLPRYLAAVATAIAGLALGTAVAWAVTAGVLGSLPAGPMLLGTLLGALYLAFATAVVATVANAVRSVVGAVFASVAVLLALPVLALVPPVAPWLPSQLVAAVTGLVAGAPASDYLRATAVAVVATAALLALAARRIEHHEA